MVASFFHPMSHEVRGHVTKELMSVQNASFKDTYEKAASLDMAGSPCLIYCHSHNGNRVEGKFLRDFCMKHNYCLVLFDFLGHGKSEGEYVRQAL